MNVHSQAAAGNDGRSNATPRSIGSVLLIRFFAIAAGRAPARWASAGVTVH